MNRNTKKTQAGWVETLRVEAQAPETEVGARLRALANWFDEHPEAPVPYDLRKNSTFRSYTYNDRIKDVIRNIGAFRKVYDGDYFNAIVDVADVHIEYYTSRSNVCTRRVVGTKYVPEQVIPEHVIEAHEEEVVEWDCREPLLASESELPNELAEGDEGVE
jgi:hypothetical protein